VNGLVLWTCENLGRQRLWSERHGIITECCWRWLLVYCAVSLETKFLAFQRIFVQLYVRHRNQSRLGLPTISWIWRERHYDPVPLVTKRLGTTLKKARVFRP